jgi:hypothetical protein
MRVTEVWFLKKKEKSDGFEDFHYDHKNIGGGVEVMMSLSQ